jgi:putative membrane protein
VTARSLDDAARTAFERAIAAIEVVSAVEVVVCVRRRSAGYRHANAIIGLGTAVTALAVMLFGAHVFALTSILVDPFVAGGTAGALVELLPGVKRVLTPRALRVQRVAQAARAAFVERGVHNTRDRSGLLVYLSWLERQVVVVADTGIARELAGAVHVRIEAALTQALAGGGAAVAGELERLAPVLARAMPRRDDDRNELPDAIDSDLDRRDRRQSRGPRL